MISTVMTVLLGAVIPVVMTQAVAVAVPLGPVTVDEGNVRGHPVGPGAGHAAEPGDRRVQSGSHRGRGSALLSCAAPVRTGLSGSQSRHIEGSLDVGDGGDEFSGVLRQKLVAP